MNMRHVEEDAAMRETLFLKKKLRLSEGQSQEVYVINKSFRRELDETVKGLIADTLHTNRHDEMLEQAVDKLRYSKNKMLKNVLSEKQWEIYERKQHAVENRFQLLDPDL
ncbi:hypothetical protein LAG90_07865 [Marinilongibacter aquaticus]|uniref:hypothetical protein n=1 Tax=Marinilongibacter aquaticus TaxID=2975157 RepID=UPI0021BD7EB1|nr:hypothetical protein [Marinilongibacter aquaticus]UBM60556.1 hypothetical protein LAG90_07865 [Marinilongibacter aquaticus]